MGQPIAYEEATGGVMRDASASFPFPTAPTPVAWLSKRATADLQIKGSAGKVHTVSIAPLSATPVAGLVTVYDSLTETGTVLWAEWVTASVTAHTITLDLPAGTGIYVGFDAAVTGINVVVSYQ
jgi:putative cofactor-binding repeat protein